MRQIAIETHKHKKPGEKSFGTSNSSNGGSIQQVLHGTVLLVSAKIRCIYACASWCSIRTPALHAFLAFKQSWPLLAAVSA
jgi:hypothetical protein